MPSLLHPDFIYEGLRYIPLPIKLKPRMNTKIISLRLHRCLDLIEPSVHTTLIPNGYCQTIVLVKHDAERIRLLSEIVDR